MLRAFVCTQYIHTHNYGMVTGTCIRVSLGVVLVAGVTYRILRISVPPESAIILGGDTAQRQIVIEGKIIK